MSEIDIRYTYVTDTPYLRDWVSNPEVRYWFPVLEQKEIDDAVQCWIGFSRYSSSLTATSNGTPCAIGTLFLMPYRKVAHHCLFKLVVDPKFQGKGIGSLLLRNLKHLAKNYFHLELMHTEVFEGNARWIHVLEKHDFRVFAKQERYVKEEGNYRARILYQSDLS
ncbi:MAG: GNAT family N-acetyltransferase [Verrucomicrobia bacterium]|nr:GNAT family N-acetyltransferase [Verrucomicrobiota bacterium]